jgi:integrase
MRGKATLYRRPGRKIWMLSYYVGPEDASRRVRESSKTTDETIARSRLAKRVRAAANAQDGISDFEEPAHRRVTVNQLFDELLADYSLREIKSLRNVKLRLAEKGKRSKLPKPLRAVFGSRRASSVTSADVLRYMKLRKEEGAANATVNREVELLHGAFSLGVKSGRIVRMTNFPEKLPEKNARQGFFETGDFRKILPFLPSPLDDMARFAFETGWRRGMLIGMRWEHVDLAGRSVTLPDSKNDDPQTMPLDGELWEVIQRRWKAREYATIGGGVGIAAHVFHRGGRPIPTSTFNTQFAEARKKAGVVGALFHDLRRTAARNMIRGGVPQSIAKRVTGHRSDSMFQRYDIASTDDKLEALHRARTYAESRAAVGENVAQFPANLATQLTPHPEEAGVSLANMVAVQGFEPRTQRI